MEIGCKGTKKYGVNDEPKGYFFTTNRNSPLFAFLCVSFMMLFPIKRKGNNASKYIILKKNVYLCSGNVNRLLDTTK